MKNINTKKGFTIIEVVLVLAIAGLIFLMVFVALPNLQRSQRDTRRRQDYSQLAAAIQNYITNHGGNMPAVASPSAQITANMANSDGKDPDGTSYIVNVVANNTTTFPALHTINVVLSANCGTDGGTITATTNTRNYVVATTMEDGQSYCQAF